MKKKTTFTIDDFEMLFTLVNAEMTEQRDFRDTMGLSKDFRADITETIRAIRKIRNKPDRMFREAEFPCLVIEPTTKKKGD